MKPAEIERKVKELNSFDSFNPMQKKALKKNIYSKNLVLSAPTASGKTIIAELSALNCIINNKKKVIYTCPLKAIASEHYREFKRRYSKEFGVRIAISTGDFDSSSKYLSKYDLILCTNEKLDSLIRHQAEWLKNVGLLIADEIHELDSGRGATLEMVISKMRSILPELQVLALSATIPNAKEIAKWLTAELVESSFRPVQLKEGILLEKTIYFGKGECDLPQSHEQFEGIIEDTLEKGKQALFFMNTRRNAGNFAKKAAKTTEKRLLPKEKDYLHRVSERAENVLESPTEQCKSLASLIRKGAAFHHAGLLPKQRELVEAAFRERKIKVISATPTLCLHPGAKVWSGIDEIPVSEFALKNRVFALSGSSIVESRVTSNHLNPNFFLLNSIETVSGHSLSLTPNHRVLVKRNSRRKLIPAGEVAEGELIATIGKLNFGETTKPKASDFISSSDFSNDFAFDEDFCYLIGYMLGDGYSGAERSRGKIIFKGSPCIVAEKTAILEHLQKTCKQRGVRSRVARNSYGTPVLHLTKANWFRELLANCGVVRGNEKFVSKKLLGAEKKLVAALLRGLFDSDGCVCRSRLVEFSNISPLLIRSVQKMLLRFGIVSRQRKRKGKPVNIYGKSYDCKDYFEINIANNKSIREFHSNIGFFIPNKKNALKDLIEKIDKSFLYYSCPHCNFKIYKSLFSGRTIEQKAWANQKIEIIKKIGRLGEIDSVKLAKKLGFVPRKKGFRVNRHYELISRKKSGANSWTWKLNDIGLWVYENFLKSGSDFNQFFELRSCPLCHTKFEIQKRGNWKSNYFEGDIFWDVVRKNEISRMKPPKQVFDLQLPKSSNDHLFVAEGILVHNSAGVNLPAFRVVIPSLYRYTEFGMQRIPVREYKQMSGRAGRPKYDSSGESVIFAHSETEFDELKECYVEGEIEGVESQLAHEPILRMHLLALIATRFVFDRASMEKFFSRTFYAEQFGDLAEIMEKLEVIAAELEDFGFVEERQGKLFATPLGKRVSDLYLDPVSAKRLIDALQKKLSVFSSLFVFTNTSEFMPWISVSKKREPGVWEDLLAVEGELPIDVSSEQFFDSALLEKFNSALLLREWIGEKSEQQLMEEFNTQPGILFSKLKICDWLAYSAMELSKLLGREENMPALLEARKRLKYGVKRELLPLVELLCIGRVRSRRLFRAGFRSAAALKKATFADLGRILGEAVARSVKEQLGQKVPASKEKLGSKAGQHLGKGEKAKAAGQSVLSSFK